MLSSISQIQNIDNDYLQYCNLVFFGDARPCCSESILLKAYFGGCGRGFCCHLSFLATGRHPSPVSLDFEAIYKSCHLQMENTATVVTREWPSTMILPKLACVAAKEQSDEEHNQDGA